MRLDLESAQMGTLEGVAAEKPDHHGRQTSGMAENGDALMQLQAALAEAARHVPGELAVTLLADATREDLVAVLAQLEPPDALLVLAQVALLPVPDRHAVLTGLFAAGPSDAAHVLRASLAAQTRQALLGRIFSPARVQALKRACRNLTKETT